jgi:hypothetical protein
MMRFAAALAVLAALSVAAAVAVAQTPANITAAKLTASFKRSTGDKLVPNKNFSYPGHYKAYDAGVATIAKKGKYGTFTVYLVTGADVEAEVTSLLGDAHTGVLGTPGPGKIYWESGTTVYGDRFWMAKKRYGGNVVLSWIGSKPVKKTDKTFKRLHLALTKATS